jgi:hydrogenase-1 operon protein HyaF
MDGSGQSAYLSISEGPACGFEPVGDTALVDALLLEIAGLLRELIANDRPGRIDLLELPLSPSCLSMLAMRLGQGEVALALNTPGSCQIRETAFPGVWWNSQADETGRLAVLFIEVAVVPRFLHANVANLRFGHQLLVDAARFNQRRKFS